MIRKLVVAMTVMVIFLLSGCQEKQEMHDYEICVKIFDLTAPVIECKNKIEITQYQDLDLKKYVSVSDNLDSNLPFAASGEVNTVRPGEYPIVITAIDTAGNRQEKEIVVIVKEKPAEKPSSNGGGGSGSSGSGGSGGSSGSKPKPKKKKTYTEKFLFNDGYDMNSAYNACVARGKKMSSTWECTPMKGSDGIYTGYKLTYKK